MYVWEFGSRASVYTVHGRVGVKVFFHLPFFLSENHASGDSTRSKETIKVADKRRLNCRNILNYSLSVKVKHNRDDKDHETIQID